MLTTKTQTTQQSYRGEGRKPRCTAFQCYKSFHTCLSVLGTFDWKRECLIERDSSQEQGENHSIFKQQHGMIGQDTICSIPKQNQINWPNNAVVPYSPPAFCQENHRKGDAQNHKVITAPGLQALQELNPEISEIAQILIRLK